MSADARCGQRGCQMRTHGTRGASQQPSWLPCSKNCMLPVHLITCLCYQQLHPIPGECCCRLFRWAAGLMSGAFVEQGKSKRPSRQPRLALLLGIQVLHPSTHYQELPVSSCTVCLQALEVGTWSDQWAFVEQGGSRGPIL